MGQGLSRAVLINVGHGGEEDEDEDDDGVDENIEIVPEAFISRFLPRKQYCLCVTNCTTINGPLPR